MICKSTIKRLMEQHDYCITESATIAFARAVERQAMECAIELCRAEMEDWSPKSLGRAAVAHCIERLQDASSEKEGS